jgi:hypothetical protein
MTIEPVENWLASRTASIAMHKVFQRQNRLHRAIIEARNFLASPPNKLMIHGFNTLLLNISRHARVAKLARHQTGTANQHYQEYGARGAARRGRLLFRATLTINAFVDGFEECLADGFSESCFVEVFCRDFFVLFHAVDEESFECFEEDVAEVLDGVR